MHLRERAKRNYESKKPRWNGFRITHSTFSKRGEKKTSRVDRKSETAEIYVKRSNSHGEIFAYTTEADEATKSLRQNRGRCARLIENL